MKYIKSLLLATSMLVSCGDNSKLAEDADAAFMAELKASSNYPESIKIDSKEVTYSEDSIYIFSAKVIANDSPSHTKKYSLECAYVVAEDESFTLITNLDKKLGIRTQYTEHNVELKKRLLEAGLGTEIVVEDDDPRVDWFFRNWCTQKFHLSRVAKAFGQDQSFW